MQRRAHPSGRCDEGVIPDGKIYIRSYHQLGQVKLDDVVGITNTVKPEAGKNFNKAIEFCLAGNIELKRDQNTHDFIEGLPFWQKPSDEAGERVEISLAYYAQDQNNIPLPTTESLLTSNPPCYTSSPSCFDGTKSTPCSSGDCETVTDASSCPRYPPSRWNVPTRYIGIH